MFTEVPVLSEVTPETWAMIARIGVILGLMLVLFMARGIIAGVIYRPIKSLFQATDTRLDDRILEAIKSVSSYLILGFGALFAALVLAPADSDARTVVLRIAITLFAIAAFRTAYSIVAAITSSSGRLNEVTNLNIDEAMMPVIRVTLKIVVALLGFLTIVQIWGISVAGIVAGVGLGGLAVSLAAKDILDDVLGFLTIIGDNIFTREEYIISPHAEGIIEHIGIRSTRIRQLNQALVIVPNGVLANDAVTNWSRLEKRWFNFLVGVTYQSTAAQIESFVSETRAMLEGRESVQNDSIVVLFTEYDESALNILVRCYINIEDWTEAKQERHAVNLAIMQIVDDLGMSIAYPTRSLFVEDIPMVTTSPNGSKEERASQPGRSRTGDRQRERNQGQYRGGQDAEPSSVEDAGDSGDDAGGNGDEGD